ncbi:hypothetical protein SUDANB5_06822 [Streptomyces sp. SudanB5_2050]
MAAPGGTGVSRCVHRGHRRGEPGEADARISPGSATGVVTFPLRAECSTSAATLCRRSRPSAAASTRRPRTSRPRTSGTPPSPGYGGQIWASDLGSQAGVRASEEYRVRMLAGCYVGAASGVLVGVSGRSVDEALVAGEEQVKGFTWARRGGQRCRHSWAAGYDRVRLTDVPGWVGDVRLFRWRLPAEAAHATAARAAAGDGRPASSRWSNSRSPACWSLSSRGARCARWRECRCIRPTRRAGLYGGLSVEQRADTGRRRTLGTRALNRGYPLYHAAGSHRMGCGAGRVGSNGRKLRCGQPPSPLLLAAATAGSRWDESRGMSSHGTVTRPRSRSVRLPNSW